MGKFKTFLKKYLPASSRTTNGRLDILEYELKKISDQQYIINEKIQTVLFDLQTLSFETGKLQQRSNANEKNIFEITKQLDEQFNDMKDILSNQMDKICVLEGQIVENKLDMIKREKELVNKITQICEKRTNKRKNTNLVKQTWELAGLSTAQYINEYMAKVNIFETPELLREHAVSQSKIEGLYLEFGVFSGKSINQVAGLKPEKTIYGFDSFKGLPETWRTGFPENEFAMEKLPIVKENVKLEIGYFDETLPEFVKKHLENCAYIHIDCDLYSSTKTIFEFLEDKFVEGTIIVFDEYFNYPSWQENEFKAFQEFVNEKNLRYEYIGYVPDWEQVAVKII